MVDLSINYCIDLRNGRCSSLDRSAEFKSQQHQIRNDSEDIVHHNVADDDDDLHETYYLNLRKQSNLNRPSCPPALFITTVSLDQHSERDEPAANGDDLEDEEEFYDCEDGDYDDESRQSCSSKRISSASRSPAPEYVRDGAQAEENAEVEISEVIALRYSRFSLAHQPSLLIKPGTEQKGGSINSRIQVPELKKPDDPEEEAHTMMKRYLIPICTIGEGAFGRVQLCQHRDTGRYYALKSMYIPKIVERRQVEHVHQEKRILQALDHPFIVRLWDTAKDAACLYMVMEFLPGGELFSYFRAVRKFTSQSVKFYAAEIILALEYLHSIHIAYRDLKPENLMVSLHGHIKLTDFGFAKVIHNRSYTLCGTPGYLAPEVFERKGHNQSVDWWALGVLIFELLAGEQPFRGKSPEEIYEAIQDSKENGLHFPKKTFSPSAKDVIRGLLRVEGKERMGAAQLKKHHWFLQYDWTELLNRNYKPPFLPTVYDDGDTGNFDSYQETEQLLPAKQYELDMFDEW